MGNLKQLVLEHKLDLLCSILIAVVAFIWQFINQKSSSGEQIAVLCFLMLFYLSYYRLNKKRPMGQWAMANTFIAFLAIVFLNGFGNF